MQPIKNKLKGMGLTYSTIKTYSSILKRFFEHFKKTSNFTFEEMESYLDYLMVVKDLKASSRNLTADVLEFYSREFLDDKIEFRKAKVTKEIQPVCWDEDYKQILSVTPNIKHKLCLNVMRYSGLRRAEVVKVMKHHIMPTNRLFVKFGKGQKSRYTIMPPQIYQDINNFKSLLPAENPYVFQGQGGKGHYSPETPNEILNNAFDKLGWSKERRYGCHALRRFCIIFMVDNLHLDFDKVSKYHGHSIMRTTQIYTESRKLSIEEDARKYEQVEIVC